MTAKVLFNFIGHFQTNYHSIDINIIKFNIDKKDILVCSVPQNSTISQFKHVTLLPGLVTRYHCNHEKFPFISGS